MSWSEPEIGERPVAVLGAGILGRRIACSWVAGGFNVILRDPSAEQRFAALHYIDNNVADFAKVLGLNATRGKYAAVEDLDTAVQNAWIVIEAVPEQLELKRSTFADLATKAPADCILGSNSSSFKSSLMLDKVDAAAKTRCLNVHYTMPPGNRIVELMTSTYTDGAIFPFLLEQLKAVGLLPAVARKESTGFIFNRLWAAVKRETLTILAEGVSDAAEIDSLWIEFFGRSGAGPCTIMDAVGLDTVAFIEDNYIRERHLNGTNTVDFLRRNYIDQGKLGAKSGKGGFYPPGYTTKPKPERANAHDNLVAPTLYLLDIGLGENVETDYAHAGRILIASADGSKSRVLLSGLEGPDGIDIDLSSGRIFWTSMGIPSQNNGSVLSANLDGSDIQTIVPKGETWTPKQLVVDNMDKKVYFSDREGLRVHRVNFDGTGHEIIVQTGDCHNVVDREDQTKWCVGISVDPVHGKFYWTQKGFSKAGKGRIFRANIITPLGETAENRSDIETLFQNLPEPIDLDLDPEEEILYWTDRGEYPLGNSVNRAYVGAITVHGKSEVLTRHLHEAIGVKVDKTNKHIYFTDLGGTVYRTDLDGKNKTKVLDAECTFAGIAILHV